MASIALSRVGVLSLFAILEISTASRDPDVAALATVSCMLFK